MEKWFILWLQVLIMSVYTGVVFFRVNNDPEQLVMNLKRGVFFVSVMNMTLINLGQLPALLEERAIYYKQQGAHFYRPQSFLFAKIVGSLPLSLLEVRVPAGFIFSHLRWPGCCNFSNYSNLDRIFEFKLSSLMPPPKFNMVPTVPMPIFSICLSDI